MNKYLSMNARDILYDMHHRVCLKVGDSYLRITECEYYPWDDVYTHRHPKQREVGTIYVHRASHKEDSAYKGGSFKSMDITLNGGILIRGIRDNDSNVEIEGPCNIVDYVCGKMEWSLEELEGKTKIMRCRWNDRDIIYGARVGLTLKRADDLELWAKSMILPYRSSIIIPSKQKQTFFATDIERNDIITPAIKRWRDEYESGKSMVLAQSMTLLQIAGHFRQ